MKKIIDSLLAMQKTDYVPDSMGYEVLDRAITLLTQLYDKERKSTVSLKEKLIENPGAMSGTITIGNPDIHWEKHL
jgi:hypothetical protein